MNWLGLAFGPILLGVFLVGLSHESDDAWKTPAKGGGAGSTLSPAPRPGFTVLGPERRPYDWAAETDH